ncbi:hypothetical protein F1654_08760 [Alkalicaulis satelles]|uniref:Uncharacterized protein n=1 Tax=Alkalicaulis satelles TaxID=2609175 RepID=A0A5M6ZPG3_9PROT|nr:hypothetical protein F1654_08760 [Alkalicaulis satelles]
MSNLAWLAAGLAAGLILALIIYIVRASARPLVSGLLRAATFPYRFVLRLLGSGRRAAAGAGDEAVEAAAAAAVSGRRTLTEAALGDDFAHEDSFLQRQGVFFKWLSVRVGYMRMPEELTDALAKDYARLANGFLGGKVPIESDARALFEDVEGAVIAHQFHESDRGAIYLLNESRKLMNANVLKLASWFSLILGAVLLINIVLNDTGMIAALSPIADEAAGPITGAQLSSLIAGAGSCLLAALVMWALYYAEYSPYQRNTARETANFLTRYLARVNDHYRTAIGKAKSVTVGQERDSKHLAEEAQLWALNINWLALRVFFIETYVRNIQFQIRRNSIYYLIFVPAAFLGALIGVLTILASFTGLSPFETIAALGWVFLILFVLVAALYAFFLSSSMKSLDEIDQGEWISFHTLRLNAVLGEVVGKYAEDVGYWKNRVGGGL